MRQSITEDNWTGLTLILSVLAFSVIGAASALGADDTSAEPAPGRASASAARLPRALSKERAIRIRAGRQGVVLWTDPSTGQLFARPGFGRVRIVIPLGVLQKATANAAPEKHIEQRVEEKIKATVDPQIARSREESRLQSVALASQIQTMKPAWLEYTDLWLNKVRIGTLLYADYAFYSHTGFGPQFLTEINPPGPGNNLYNSFDITRAYLNFYFSPTDDWTFRATPEIYRTAGAAGSASKLGRVSAVGSNLDGNLGLRVRYAYLDYNRAFKWSEPLSEDKITFGVQPNAFNDWINNLYGFRYVNRPSWNYVGLTEALVGLSAQGPVKFGELQYLDYDLGVYGNGTYRTFENTNTKQVMVRGSFYPFGARSRFDGLGITGFYDYGYQDNTPDSTNLIGPSSGQRLGHISRLAALLHYTAETWGIAGEYDAGHDAYRSSNAFSGTGPFDEFSGTGITPGGATASTCVGPGGDALPGCFTAFDALVKAIQNNGAAAQEGYAFYGHVGIPKTNFTLFGMFQEFFANTKVDRNPIDFQRFVVGLEYKWNKNLRFALDSQNLLYPHRQFTFPKDEANAFGENVVSPLASAGPGPKGTSATPFPVDVTFAVPRDIHAIFFNLEFSYE